MDNSEDRPFSVEHDDLFAASDRLAGAAGDSYLFSVDRHHTANPITFRTDPYRTVRLTHSTGCGIVAHPLGVSTGSVHWEGTSDGSLGPIPGNGSRSSTQKSRREVSLKKHATARTETGELRSFAPSPGRGVVISRETIVDQLARTLSEEILTGRLAPGSLLPPEREFASTLGVTRTSLKHTLARLEQAGLIETRHGVGSEVLDFAKTGGAGLLPLLLSAAASDSSDSSEWILDWIDGLFEARRLFGAVIAAEAARNRSAGDVEELTGLLEALSLQTRPEGAQLVEAEIHRVIARSSGNRVFVLVVNSILDAYMSVGSLLVSPFRDPAALAALFGPVLTAIARGDVAAAKELSERYLSATGDSMLAALGVDANTREWTSEGGG